MKKKFVILPFIAALLLSACKIIAPSNYKVVEGIVISNPVTEYYLNDEFIKPDVYIKYMDGTRGKNVKEESAFSGYDMTYVGEQNVHVSYQSYETDYTITVLDLNPVVEVRLTNLTTEYFIDDEFDGPNVTLVYQDETTLDVSNEVTFAGYDMSTVGTYEISITYKGEVIKKYDITVSEHPSQKELLSITVHDPKTEYYTGDEFEKPDVYAEYSDGRYYNVKASAEFSGYNMTIVDKYDVIVSFGGKTTSYKITVSKRPPVYEEVTIDIALASELGKQPDLNGTTKTYNSIIFAFSKGSGQNPISTKDHGGYVALYTGNFMKVSNQRITKIVINYSMYQDKYGEFEVDSGQMSYGAASATWTGDSSVITFTAKAQARILSVSITYLKDTTPDPVLDGISTIETVRKAANQIMESPNYIPNDQGWYLSTSIVKMKVEAIDAIDSVATSEGYDGNARGKVLVVDESGYIMCSSSTSTNEPISFYQRVKDYIKKGTTQYEISGHIAFLNGVPEVKVDTYEYNSSIVIDKKYEEYVEETFSTSDEFVSDTVDNALPNAKGYGVNHIVKMTGLTYFNKYNSAGSYLFLDQDGNIVPVYSLLDKDRTMLVEGQVYDIIGLESVYKYRPSFRILKVSKSSLNPVDFDFENDAVEVSNLSSFYSIGEGTSEAYVNSELTIYKADVYVSSYGEDKYTINTSYHVNPNGGFTTGYSEVDAANHNSLGIFNEKLDYKQVLLDYLIDGYSSEEDIQDLKVTLYFTLAYLNIVNKKNMWRVNIFEDVIYGLDYYHSEIAEMTFDTSKSHCDREDGVYQQWSNDYNSLIVRNESTEYATIQRNVDYLRVVDSTSLKITFDHDIIAFTFYTGTYSGVAGLGNFTNVKAYVKRSTYITVVLKEKTKIIDIDELYVSGSANYLKVTSMSVNYI